MDPFPTLLARPARVRYGFAFAVALAEILARTLLTPVWGTDVRLIAFSPAVLFAAWIGGAGPGLFATAVCALGASWWLPPPGSLLVGDPHDRVALVLFLAAGALTSAVIGALHRTRRRVEHLQAVADAANRAKDEALAILGHELRAPVQAITMAARVLDGFGPGEEDAARFRGVIVRQSEQLARMVDDLLVVGRLTAGKIVLDRRPIDLAEAAQRCVDTLSAAGRTERHALRMEAEPVWVEADPLRIEQVVVNLLGNALKYTPPGGSIRLSVKREAAGAVLRVQDSGVGIAPDVLPHVFELFVQEDRQRERAGGGLGIGLSVVRRLVELHGGTVRAASDGPGRGSTLTVCLPARPI